MNYKRLGALAILLIVLSFPAFASLVSFIVVETGLGEGISSTQHGSVWEGGLMEVFFDAGYIVTNSPVARMESIPIKDLTGFILMDFEEAAMGGAEYFILGLLECQAQGGRAIPLNMILKLYSTESRELIFEQSFPISLGRTLAQEFEIAKDAGRIILNQIKDS